MHVMPWVVELGHSVILILVLNFEQTVPRLLDCPSLENVNVKKISCGARHSALITGIL